MALVALAGRLTLGAKGRRSRRVLLKRLDPSSAGL